MKFQVKITKAKDAIPRASSQSGYFIILIWDQLD